MTGTSEKYIEAVSFSVVSEPSPSKLQTGAESFWDGAYYVRRLARRYYGKTVFNGACRKNSDR